MAELEKVIKQLEVLIEDSEYSEIIDLTPDDAKSILELLKEQEAVKPKIDAFRHPYCPKCKILVYETWEFCPHCGKKMKWE